MTGRGKSEHFRKRLFKPMGLILAPFVFTLIICGVLLLVANATVGDVIGYGSALLMKPTVDDHNVTDFLAPAEPGKGTEDTISIKDVTFPTFEQVCGEISMPSIDLVCPMIYGDSDAAIKKGAGQFIGSSIIGYGGTTMICAHVNRHFKNLHKAQIGDLIHIRTTYGYYTYEVKYVGVHDASDDSIYDLGREDENVVLYTCYYEKTALGSVKKRFFVCADYVSGPMIVDWSTGE